MGGAGESGAEALGNRGREGYWRQERREWEGKVLKAQQEGVIDGKLRNND